MDAVQDNGPPDVLPTDTSDATDTADGTDTTDTGDTNDTSDQPGCSPACGVNSACVDGTCVCGTGFGDCNADPTDGCEASLDQPETCGTCDPGALCDTPNIVAICTVSAVGTTGACDPTTCAEGYLDLDGDTALETPTNGCETGMSLIATANLSADLPGAILEMVLDGDTIYALIDDTTLKIAPIDISGAMPVVGTVVDTTQGAGSGSTIIADNGIVTILGSGLNFAFVYENVSGTLTAVRGITTGYADLAAVTPTVTTNATAEFIAVGASGTTWYGVFPQGMTPGGFTCVNGDPGTSVALCTLDTLALPTGAAFVTAGTLNSMPLAMVAGAATEEFILETPPNLLRGAVSGDALSTTLTDSVVHADAIWGTEGSALVAYTYTFDMSGEPATRSLSTVADLMTPLNAVAVLDDLRAVVGSESGLSVVAVGTGDFAAVAGPSAVSDVVVNGTTVYAADGTDLWVFDADLATF